MAELLAPRVELAVFAGQLIHVLAEVALTAALYFPAGQRVQVFDSTAAKVLYVPAAQLVHTFAEKDYVPAGQFEHEVAPHEE